MILFSRRSFFTALGASALATPTLAQTDPLARRFGGPFTLTAHDGARMSDTDFRGRFMLIYFGFTHCADTCSGDLLTTGHALDALGDKQARIQPLFITVDPGIDTPRVMADYVGNFHPRLVGLTGSEAEIAAVAKVFRVHRMLMDIRPRSDVGEPMSAALNIDRHARPWAGHPRIPSFMKANSWMAGPSPAMTRLGSAIDEDSMIHLAHGPDAHPYREGKQTVEHGSLTYLMGPDGGFLSLFPTNTDAQKMSAILANYLAKIPA